jgi:hypothetical protein
MKSISTHEILQFMREGRAYVRASFYRQFPDVDRRLVNDALLTLVQRGEIWNGNVTNYVKFPPKVESKAGEPIICPSHEWSNLTGYDDTLRSFRRVAEGTRGEGYTAPEYAGNVLSGRQRESFQQRAEAIRGLQ